SGPASRPSRHCGVTPPRALTSSSRADCLVDVAGFGRLLLGSTSPLALRLLYFRLATVNSRFFHCSPLLRLNGKSRPRIGKPQEFPYDIERVAGVAPPVGAVIAVLRGVAHH